MLSDFPGGGGGAAAGAGFGGGELRAGLAVIGDGGFGLVGGGRKGRAVGTCGVGLRLDAGIDWGGLVGADPDALAPAPACPLS